MSFGTRTAFAALVLPALALACSSDSGTGPGGDAGVRLVILPGAVLLPGPGETAELRAVTISAEGDTAEVEGTVSWASSAPSIVSVASSGVATAGTLGGAVVTAEADGLSSDPILAVVAVPAAGALLVSDEQVIGGITPVDPAAPYQPGWQYRVRLRGVNPEVGQVVLASGGSPVGGRVVSLTSLGGDEVEVVLELLGFEVMFEDLTLNVSMPLESASAAASENRRMGVSRLSQASARLPGGEAQLSRVEQEFSIGSFDCKAELPPLLTFPIALETFDAEVFPQLSLDVQFAKSALQRLVVHGSVEGRVSANPLLTAGIEGKAECKLPLKVINIPVPGPLGLLIGGQVPVGVGFEAGVKATFGQLGFDAFSTATLSTQFGIDCTGECAVVADGSTTPPDGFFKPQIPSFEDDLRFELVGSAFLFAELRIGNRFLEELQFEVVELKGGPEQKFELAGRKAQALDPAYASTFALKPVIEFKTSSKLQAVGGMLGITLAELSFAPELPVISLSPRGTFAITPGSVAAGDGSNLGEMATFTVTLDPVDYFGAYAVESVDIMRRREVDGAVTLEPGRPGCTRVEAAQDQTVFTCQADFLEEDAGEQTFHAFVNALIFGVPVPAALEVAADGKATVTVTTDDSPPEVCRRTVYVGATQFVNPIPPDTFLFAGSPGVATLTCATILQVNSGASTFSSLTHVLKTILVLNDVTEANFPELRFIGDHAQFSSDRQAAIDLPKLVQVGDFSDDAQGLVFIGLNALTTLGIGPAHMNGGLLISGNPLLTDISGLSCGIVLAETLEIRLNSTLPSAQAEAKAACITAAEKVVSDNGP